MMMVSSLYFSLLLTMHLFYDILKKEIYYTRYYTRRYTYEEKELQVTL